MIRKAVITAAGFGTRLLPFTKEQPKEMLPIYSLENNGFINLKPALQIIFEQLYNFGIREFCFIVGRGKRVIEDYFTPDYNFKRILEDNNNIKSYYVSHLDSFYSKIRDSSIIWINQSPPKGFGHAVLLARSFVGVDEDFFVCAGDTIILSEENNNNNNSSSYLFRLKEHYEKENAHTAFLLLKVNDPYNYGVAFGKEKGDIFYVNKLVEKPSTVTSDLAIMPIYILKNMIFDHLKSLKPYNNNEIQLTDAIQLAISNKKKVIGINIKNNKLRLDIGNPENYFAALTNSYYYSKRLKYKSRNAKE